MKTATVSSKEFRQHFDRYLSAAQNGSDPVAITQASEVVGFFISKEKYEHLFGIAIKKLLASRAKGKTISHEEACKRIRAKLRQP